MTTIDWETYEDEYEYMYDQPQGRKVTKMKSGREDNKKKNKKVRHVPKQELWDEYSEEDDEDFAKTMFQEVKKSAPEKAAKPVDKPKYQPKPAEQKPQQRSGVNVHTIKNVQIDFDGVKSIEKIQNTYNNKETYGIKFNFKSKNNTFRVIWFNQNVRERDSVYNTEFAFWSSINTK